MKHIQQCVWQIGYSSINIPFMYCVNYANTRGQIRTCYALYISKAQKSGFGIQYYDIIG